MRDGCAVIDRLKERMNIDFVEALDRMESACVGTGLAKSIKSYRKTIKIY